MRRQASQLPAFVLPIKERPRFLSSQEVEAAVEKASALICALPRLALTPLQRMQLSGRLFPFCSAVVGNVVYELAHADGRVGPLDGPAQAEKLGAQQERASRYH